MSLFEAHTDIICRGKLNRRVEFGHKVWLCEVDGGLISDYRLLCGNPHDTFQWQTSLEKHIEQFGRAPTLASADRGVYSQPNETIATQKGVKRVILPKSGYKSKQRQQQEKQRSFRRGRYWHNGVEGRKACPQALLWIEALPVLRRNRLRALAGMERDCWQSGCNESNLGESEPTPTLSLLCDALQEHFSLILPEGKQPEFRHDF